jgi:hypothetical protein
MTIFITPLAKANAVPQETPPGIGENMQCDGVSLRAA